MLVSGGGSNLQSLMDFAADDPSAGYKISAVVSDRNAYGIERARKGGIATWELDRKEGPALLAEKLDAILSGKVDLIVLAGFLSILDSSFIEKWEKNLFFLWKI